MKEIIHVIWPLVVVFIFTGKDGLLKLLNSVWDYLSIIPNFIFMVIEYYSPSPKTVAKLIILILALFGINVSKSDRKFLLNLASIILFVIFELMPTIKHVIKIM